MYLPMSQHARRLSLSVLATFVTAIIPWRGHTPLLLLVLLASALALAACGGAGPQELEVAVEIGEEKMNPETVRVKQGDTVTLKINAEEPGEFHLHGYDLELDVEATEVADMVFVADATGRFRITFHHQEEGDEHKPGSGGSSEEKPDEEGERDIGFLEVLPR